MLHADLISSGLVALKPSRFPGLALDATEVHLWQASLDGRAADIFESFLSADELTRANRFHFIKDRNHFVVARGLLRNLLAAYLGVNCAELRFSYGAQGKPTSMFHTPMGAPHLRLPADAISVLILNL